jgi:alkylhydroperoxidase family enzyme
MSLLRDGALPAELRELAILRVAWRLRSEYVWGGHAAMAGPDVATLASGGSPTPEQAVVVRATDELLDTGTVAAGTWDELSEVLSPGQLVELVLTVGNYRTVAALDAVFELRPEPGLPRLPPPAG